MGRSFTDKSNISATVALLAEWGVTAEPLHLGDDLIDVSRVRLDYDLYVLKNRRDLAMSVAADLHGAGAALLNPYPVSALLRDRIVTFRVLRPPFARTSDEQEGRPFAPSPELAALARRCGAAFGIDLFSVDVVKSDGRAYVVDMSSFPGFKGVPDAPLRLAKYIYAAAQRAARGEPVVPAELLAAPAAARRAFKGSTLELVLRAL